MLANRQALKSCESTVVSREEHIEENSKALLREVYLHGCFLLAQRTLKTTLTIGESPLVSDLKT